MKHLSEEQIAQYAEALARGNQKYLPKTITEHVKECDDCAEEVLSVYEIITQEQDKKMQTKENHFFIRTVKWVSIAAGITLMVGLGGYLLFKTNKPDDAGLLADKQEQIRDSRRIVQIIEIEDTCQNKTMEIPSEHTDTQKVKTNNEVLLAQAFEPNNRLENLASRFEQEQMRSNNFELKSDHYKIIQPTSGSIELSWKAPAEEELIFTLLNNRDSLVVEKNAGKQGVQLSEPLGPGLYYWKLINAEFELLYCGKIKVEKP